ncbi:DNA cytosine methyltransferase [Nostoc sp. CHAB 5836]|uniref:DNA cytosine methyltransferase n=1 Tax=Nostoc sp. CHAB 5836 TaxID=2780404 RepID=UPI001E3F8B1B|nr:DNA cytosine methyltransferase [Nostoc sp. CHAB 5836]MCC5618798.1 DNA cytosine methyltransferase [Nostoc sp. CHAB 5836]
MQQLTQLDLCSGVGAGFPVAGTKLGFKLIGTAEIDPYCSGILAKRFPGIRNYGDVRNLALDYTGAIDLITASPPCPPFSTEGDRKGADDERDCFPAILKIIANYKPRFAVIENVTGLLTCPERIGDERGYFRYVLQQLSDGGYDAEWITLGSGHCDAPFIRERVLLVAVSRSIELQWQGATTWADQARGWIEGKRCDRAGASGKPGISREQLQSSTWLDRPTGKQISIGVASGNGSVRHRRAALGNALDWRVASIGLRRILYLNSIAE